MRLQKYIADAGIASRRKAEEMISKGRVTINGIVAQIGAKVEDGDEVLIDGFHVARDEKLVYIVVNKPAGVICSAKDQFGRETVVDLVGDIDARLYPVGRLDFHSTGLVILTNDGELTNKLTHPRHGHTKTYMARVKNCITQNDVEAFNNGIEIDDYVTKPVEIELLDNGWKAKIVLREGRNRQIRKMFNALGNEIVSLKRVAMGNVGLEGLESGQWRYLSAKEVEELSK